MSEAPKKRGRPRQFDPSAALAAASRTFLENGYSGTSVDALSSAMEIAKPSLYAAFGDKRALFLEVLQRRAKMVGERYAAAFAAGDTLEEAFRNVLEAAVDVSLGHEGGPPGCPIAAASSTEALLDPAIGVFARQFRAQSDKAVTAWIRKRAERGDEVDAAERAARLMNAVVVDLALRARVGESRTKLREIARESARVLAHAAASSG